MKKYLPGLLLFFLVTTLFAQGTYYDNINPRKTTFLNDLKNRIRNPYTWVPYSQFDETNIANFASIDNGDGTKSVFCVYSHYEYIYSGTFQWDVLSREHTWAHSWMPTNPADSPIERDEYADQHHLFPTHQNNANAIRSNYPLGEVVTPDYTFLESQRGTDANGNYVYEPRDPHKGDAARALLYMSVRYDDIEGYDWSFNWLNNHIVNDLGNDPQDLDLLLQWHWQDLPDQWEKDRNDYVQSIQDNRNPFVDHPEYVNYIDFNDLTYKSPDLFFSEYVEGSGNNKALEIFNNTHSTIDLNTGGYTVEIYANGNTNPSTTISLTGSIVNGDVFVLANSSADQAILDVADQTTGSVNFNGDDAVVLKKGTEILDVIGQIGNDPGAEWGTGDASTKDNTLRRKSIYGAGDTNGNDAFDPADEWNGYPQDTFDGLGSHSLNASAPTITNVTRSPNVPLENENTVVTADITDSDGIGAAILKYKINDGPDNSVTMTNTGGSTYQGTIPESAYTDGDLVSYWIYAEDVDGVSSNSATSQYFAGTVTISKLHEVDANGVATYLDTYARITGTATVESGIFSTSSLDVYIQDNTQGINIYKGGETGVTVIRGNSYTVVGKVQQYNGKTEIIPDNASDITDNGPTKVNAVPDPLILTIAQLLADPESYEGTLIGIQHASNTGGGDAWPADGNNANVEITDDGGAHTLKLRIDKDTDIDGSPEPAWPKDIVGVFNQYDNTSPYTWGYQIQPRDLNDFHEDGSLPVELTTFSAVQLANGILLKWQTATEVNNYGFEIQRLFSDTKLVSVKNNDNWTKIAFVQGHGNSNSPKNYSYLDKINNKTGYYYYRLKQTDINGEFEFSPVIEVSFAKPQVYELTQNYPNPFNPSTVISYSLPEETVVNLSVYNMLGELVKVIVNTKQNAGNYKVNFDASGLTSGFYIYKLTTPTFSKVKKMLLIR